ncbi:hypothetical protein HG536_0G03350 [Torulaspora globosa]|uniref:Rad61 Wapl domain-containing protein n=1 Tax=Torulaspora globosa TaxID=48254 RepID=A0A7G3ZLT7_9SACH|nr:uncharacterized protein HG536_0G03350 [Torulaspora globosa]QLL34473.1 hypothetical protein HG536_0G03350 [Torulaspora globosa]
MVRVYGKRSRSWTYDSSQYGDESMVELSDDGEIEEIKQPVTANEPDNITLSRQDESNDADEESLRISSSTVSFIRDTCNATSTSVAMDDDISPLKAFDFLQGRSAVKKRKTNYKKVSVGECEDPEAPNGSESSIDKTVDRLNQFLASLQPANAEDQIKDQFERELKKSVEEDYSCSFDKVMYDRSRTILFNEDEDGIEVQEPDQQTEVAAEIPKTGRKAGKHLTHHYKELKNIGEVVKYQDELQFLTDESPSKINIETFISRFLGLAMAIEQDEEFLEYINRHAANEICRWCFSKELNRHPVVTLLQSFLLTKVRLPPEYPPSDFEHLVVLSLGCDEPPSIHSLTGKLRRMNLTDFLNKTGKKSAQDYSLQLCLNYPDQLLSQEVTRRILDIAIQRDLDQESSSVLFPLVEHILSSGSPVVGDTSSILLGSLICALPKQCCNEDLVKSLIMLSNENKVLTEAPVEQKQKLMHCSLGFILRHIHPIADSTADLVILYLGLLLNMLDVCDARLFEKQQLDHARKLLPSISTSDTDPFIVCMYSLNLAHILFGAGERLHEEEKDLLMRILNSYDKEGININQAIRDQVKAALNNFL